MRKTAGRSLLWQTFFRYGGLLIAAAVVFGAVVGYQNVSVLVRESETLIASSLTTSAAWMDARVAEMDAIAYHIVDSSLLYPYEIFRNGYTAAQATNLLNSYKNANAYLSDIVLYYDESVAALFDAEPRYFTTTGPMNAETFWHYIHPVSSGRLSPGLVVTMPQQSMLIHPVTETVKNQERRFLLYLTPAGKMPMWENHRGLILFFIEESVVNEGLARTALLYDGVLGVYNTDGDAMYRYGEAPQTLDGHILDMVQDAGGQPVIAHTGSGVCVALRTQAHGLTYVLTLPAGFNAPAIYSAIASLLPFVALLTILALWGAYLLLRPLFRPMQQLKDMLRPYSLQSDESLSGIVYSIRELEAHRDRLESLGQPARDAGADSVPAQPAAGRVPKPRRDGKPDAPLRMRLRGGALRRALLPPCARAGDQRAHPGPVRRRHARADGDRPPGRRGPVRRAGGRAERSVGAVRAAAGDGRQRASGKPVPHGAGGV